MASTVHECSRLPEVFKTAIWLNVGDDAYHFVDGLVYGWMDKWIPDEKEDVLGLPALFV